MVFIFFFAPFGCATQKQVSISSEPSGASVVVDEREGKEPTSREDIDKKTGRQFLKMPKWQ